MRALLIGFLIAAAPAMAQRFGAGVKGGVRATGDLDSYWATSESKRYVVGPVVEIGLPGRFAVEGNAMYRRFGYRSFVDTGFGSYGTRERANSWEFPLLLKYRLPVGLYLARGYAARTMSGSGFSWSTDIDLLAPGAYTYRERRYSTDYDTSHGAVGALGFEIGRGRLRVAPEFRYTRWNNEPVSISGSRGFEIHSTRNQAEILVGITWR